jgi:hypothetical protein
MAFLEEALKGFQILPLITLPKIPKIPKMPLIKNILQTLSKVVSLVLDLSSKLKLLITHHSLILLRNTF